MKTRVFIIFRRDVLMFGDLVELDRQYAGAHPRTELCVVDFGLDPGECLEHVGAWRDVGRSDYPVVFIDPHCGRNVDESIALRDNVIWIYNRRKRRVCELNPLTSGASFIKRDGNDCETEGFELLLQ